MRLLLLCLFLALPFAGRAQAVPDTLVQQPLPDSLRDTIRTRNKGQEPVIEATEMVLPASTPVPKAFVPIPKKAALYSAMLPGGGQIYNRQWWKLPIVYAGLATSFYFLVDNTNQYRKFRTAYLASLDPLSAANEPLLKQYNSQQLRTRQDSYRQYLDLTVLFTAVGYTLQVLDALVFAHLRNFDVSPDLSFKVRPVGTPAGGVGLGLVMGF